MRLFCDLSDYKLFFRSHISFFLRYTQPLVCAIFFFFFCSNAMATQQHIGLVFPSHKESRWHNDLLSFQHALPANKFLLSVKFSGIDQHQQNIVIKELVTNGVNILVVVPHDAFTVAPAIEFAKKNGVYVISYDRLAMNCDLDAYITFDNEAVGSLMAQYATDHAPTGNYIVIQGAQTDPNALTIQKKVMQHLQPFIEDKQINIVANEEAKHWRLAEAQRIVTAALKKTPDIQAIIAPNDDTAKGARLALREKHITTPVIITGQDATSGALNRVYSGKQSMTVFKDTNKLARQTLEIIRRVFEKQKVQFTTTTNNGKKDVPTTLVPVMQVTKETLPYLLRLPEYNSY